LPPKILHPPKILPPILHKELKSISAITKIKKINQKPQIIYREVILPDGVIFKGKSLKH